MKLSVLANCYGNKTLDEALAIFSKLGVEAVEIGAGGYPGKAHCNPAELLKDEDAGASNDPAYLEAQQWINAIVEDKNPCVLPEQAFCVTKILEGIYTSAKTGDIYRF